LLNFYASFAADGIPAMSEFKAQFVSSQQQFSVSSFQNMCLQACFFKLAMMFGFFAPQTKRRVIKDIP
jgi:phage terminase large subunit-like protein